MAMSDLYQNLFAASLLKARESSRVWSLLFNTDYQGDINKKGDTVTISSLSDPTIGNYVRATGMTVEQLTGSVDTLEITEEKYFAFIVQDMDEAMTNANIREEAARRAGYKLDVTLDTFLAATAIAGGTLHSGTAGTPIVVNTAADTGVVAAADLASDLLLALDEADVPGEGRVIVCPHWFHAKLRLDSRFHNATDGYLVNGVVGRFLGAQVIATNRKATLTSGGDTAYCVVAMHSDSASMAEALRKIRSNPSLTFVGDQVDGLHLYGATVTRATGVQYAAVEVDA